MNIFDILGPVMVGPSSSHTAGATKIGLTARKLLAEKPIKADIYLHGSFAATGVGHGTDKALIAGILGMQADDMRIPHSFDVAKEEGLTFYIQNKNLKEAHPNTALIEIEGEQGRTLKIQASSLGGGRIMVNKIDDIDVNFSGEYNTLIIHNVDQPGHVAEVTSLLAHKGVNVANMHLYRDRRGGYACMVIEIDQQMPQSGLDWLKRVEGIIKVTYFNREVE